MTSQNFTETFAGLVAAATAATKDRDWKTATERWRQVIAHEDAAPPSAYARLAAAQSRLHNWDDARDTLAEGLAAHPDNSHISIEMAYLRMSLGRWSEAFELWRKATAASHDPLLPQDIHGYAKCCEALGEWETHRAIIHESLIRRNDDSGLRERLLFGGAVRAAKDGQFDEAIEIFAKLSKSPSPKTWPYAFEYPRKQSQLDRALQKDKAKSYRGLVILKRIERPEVVACRSESLTGIPELLLHREKKWEKGAAIAPLRMAVEQLSSIVAPLAGPLQFLENEELARAIEEIDVILDDASVERNWLPAAGWLTLANFLLMEARFANYLKCRSYALTADAQETSKEFDLDSLPVEALRNYVRIIAETNDKPAFEVLMESYPVIEQKIGFKDAAIVRAAAPYFSDRENYIRHFAAQEDPADIPLRDLITGKSIAIVGPVDTGSRNGAEIDSFDLVLRFNYKGMAGYDSAAFGSRADFSYYVDAALRNGSFELLARAMNDLQLIMYDTRKTAGIFPELFAMVQKPMRIRYPIGYNHTNPFFKGTPNAVQRALFDILRFETGPIKIFNTNLWISNKVHPAYRNNQSYRVTNLVRHDPLSNFIFTKRLLETGLIQADQGLAGVLALSEAAYIDALDACYGHLQRG